MDSADAWRSLFESWPDAMPREGLLVTTFDEQIPFTNFLVSGGLVLLERDKPDTVGARKVMVSYNAISALKSTSTMELARFQVLGFQAPM